MSALVKKETPAVDNFDGWSDDVDGAERPEGAGIIQGTLVKFTNEATWVTRDDDEIADDLELVAVDVVRVVQKWEDGRPVETIVLEAGQKFPDLEEMNAKAPQSEWVEGPDGKPRGPWQAQHILYLVNLATMDKYTYPTGTTGGRIAVGELRDKLVWMRRARGPNLYPEVILTDTFMKTRFGGRQRPRFKIVRWVRIGGEGGEVAALPPPPSTPAPAVTLAPVQEPSVEEDFDDELPGDLAPPKKPAKASVKATPKKRANMLEAG